MPDAMQALDVVRLLLRYVEMSSEHLQQSRTKKKADRYLLPRRDPQFPDRSHRQEQDSNIRDDVEDGSRQDDGSVF
jgi:hypothetical protein